MITRGDNESRETRRGYITILEEDGLVLLMLVHLMWTIGTCSGAAFILQSSLIM